MCRASTGDRWEAFRHGRLPGGVLQARKLGMSPPVLSRARDWAVRAQAGRVQAQAKSGFRRAPPLPRVIWARKMSRLCVPSSNGFANGMARRFTHQVNSRPPGSPSRQIHVPTRLCWPRKERAVRVDNWNGEWDMQAQMQGVASSRLHIMLPRQHVYAKQGSTSKLLCTTRQDTQNTKRNRSACPHHSNTG